MNPERVAVRIRYNPELTPRIQKARTAGNPGDITGETGGSPLMWTLSCCYAHERGSLTPISARDGKRLTKNFAIKDKYAQPRKAREAATRVDPVLRILTTYA